jgi:hypothetical protein
VQLRTPLQDKWANTVEVVSRVVPGLKFGQGPPEFKELFKAAGEAIALRDQGLDLPASLQEQITGLFGYADSLLAEREK